ncbi:MAG: carbon-nitrogen family hydrolase [Akkermansiaceae bacterium]|nr:carbon-nitrogen family hydrolase [Armatimonadota bacterium]
MLIVHACQMDIVWEDKPANFARVAARLTGVDPVPGSLVVLPEMFATGFSMNARAVAEDIQTGVTAGFLSGLARQYGCYVLGGVVTRTGDDRPRNEAVVFDPSGALAGRYAKMYPFTPGGEGAHYAAGDAPVVWEIGGLRVAPLICYDLRFPEVFREATNRGAETFVVIASWPVARAHHWDTLLRARAIENQAYVVGVNRVGTDPVPLTYPGRSIIVDPSGAVLAEASYQETVLSATLDPRFVASYRRELPFLADRRDF